MNSHRNIPKNIKFLIIKAKYYVIESYYINNSILLGEYFSWVPLFFVLFLIVNTIF